MNTTQIPRRGLIAVMILTLLLVTAVGMSIARASTTAPEPEVSAPVALDSIAPQPVPVPEPLNLVGPLGFSDIQKSESYKAASQAERGIQAYMNAVAALSDGEIAGEALTPGQLSAIVDQGLNGLNLAQARIDDALAVFGLGQAALNAQASASPVPDTTWCNEVTNAWSGQSGCMDANDPAYVPQP